MSIRELWKRLKSLAGSLNATIMEVCGTHTFAFFESGVRDALPETVRLVSGPGCPVCVTPTEFFDVAVRLARDGKVVATFGDMMRVPATESSLEREKAQGRDIVVVYSPTDALEVAKRTDKEVVFFAVGFETTAPAIAYTLKLAKAQRVRNFMILPAMRLIPPAIEALVSSGAKIDGFIYPGHVATILGHRVFDELSRKIGVPGVISGFEPEDVLLSTVVLLEMISEGRGGAINEYRRSVRPEGNEGAKKCMDEVFDVTDGRWRGIGEIPKSALIPKEAYEEFDAVKRLKLDIEPVADPPGCRCGDVLRGEIEPIECPLFGRVCTPETPVGPCMVSSEGSCAAYYKYRAKGHQKA